MRRMKSALRAPLILHRVFLSALAHDCLNIGQSAAYSAIVALFPALVVAGAVIALLPDATPLKSEVGMFFYQVLPADVIPLLTGYFAASPARSPTVRALVVAAVVSLIGASSVIATLMEGLRRAEGLEDDGWSFWRRRMRALVLVPTSLLPLAIATVLVVFGKFIATWLAGEMSTSLQPFFYALAEGIRWTVALAGVTGFTALIYHLGVPHGRRWVKALPGAVMATAMWFLTTLGFGWYVTRFANYSQVYGSLGAGIALLFWLYIVCLSVLCGAEFNAQLHHHRSPRPVPPIAPVPVPQTFG